MVDSRHSGVSCIWISQSIFGGKFTRAIRINSDYLCIFKTPSDQLQVSVLSKQMTGTNILNQIYNHVTQQTPYSYIFINLTQYASNSTKFLTNLFDKQGHVVTTFIQHNK